MNRYPFVSILTPTYNRRHFIPQYLRLLRSQNYPGKFEVIIADDSDMSIRDVLGGDEIIQYHFFKEKMSLGFKREFLCQQAKGDILVHMDDDDYYSPHRVTHAVDMLTKAENLIAGASQCFFYNTFNDEISVAGPFAKNHGTAATFAYFREYIQNHHFNIEDRAQEEPAFTNQFSESMTQLDPKKTMIAIWHKNNTYDKKATSKQITNLKLKDFNVDILSRRFYKKVNF